MRSSLLVVAILVAVLLSGCNFPTASQPAPTPSGLPLPTPRPSINPLAVAAEYMTHPRIIEYDPFDNLNNWNFKPATGALVNGMFELQGTPRWQSSFWNRLEFKEGEAVAFRFQVQRANARSEFVLVTGDW